MLPKNKKLMVFFISVAVVAILGVASFLFYKSNLSPVSAKKDPVLFEVLQGDSMNKVVDRLAEQKLIKSAMVTKLYVKLHGLNDLKAGSFQLDRSWDIEKILGTINDASLADANDVKITFKEGVWAKDIAAQIEKGLGIKQADLINLWNDETYLKSLIKEYEFLSDEILVKGTHVKLEGYLFPETYSFHKNASAKDITKMFLDHFKGIYELHKADIEKSKMSIHELITLASMVQYEAKTPTDMKKVAGVFLKRIDLDMSLGSSVTVCYALYDKMKEWKDCEINSRIDSPYNTNIHKGLPIGPVTNPGEEAIMATLNPMKSDHLYFVADVYGDGKLYFAKTLEEQNANIEKFNLNFNGSK